MLGSVRYPMGKTKLRGNETKLSEGCPQSPRVSSFDLVVTALGAPFPASVPSKRQLLTTYRTGGREEQICTYIYIYILTAIL